MIRHPNSRAVSADVGSPPEGRDSLLARLLDLQPQVRRRFEAAMPTRDLLGSLRDAIANTTMRQLEVMRLLGTSGPIAMHELAERAGISRSSATEVIDRLESQGMVERHHDPDDRRSIEVALTEKAAGLVGQFRAFHQASISAFAEAYDDEELATLVGLLEKVAVPDAPGRLRGGEPSAPADRPGSEAVD